MISFTTASFFPCQCNTRSINQGVVLTLSFPQGRSSLKVADLVTEKSWSGMPEIAQQPDLYLAINSNNNSSQQNLD